MPALLPVAHAQEHNFVVINPSDSPADIVKKAANVVPSARQFNWQRQELTAFLHYGVNTYTGREWGDGTESPAIFNSRIHWSASSEEGLKIAGESVPSPHSLPVKVFIPKCKNAVSSCLCHANWRFEGTTFAAFRTISDGESDGLITT